MAFTGQGRCRAIAVALAAIMLTFYGGSTRNAWAVPLTPVGQAPTLPKDARVLGALGPNTALRVTVAMAPQDRSGMRELATAISTPGTKSFRHYLSVVQFAQRFGATAPALNAVEAAMRAGGLTVEAPLADHLLIEATGTAAEVERTFHVGLDRVRLAAGPTVFANDAPPTLASSTAGDVQGVIGLNNLVQLRPAGFMRSTRRTHQREFRRVHVELGGGLGSASESPFASVPASSAALAHEDDARARDSAVTPCTDALDAADGQNSTLGSGGQGVALTPDEVAGVYGMHSYYAAGDEGAGQTVALFEEGAYNPSDIAAYEQCYKLTMPVAVVNVDGGPGAFQSGGEDGEQALDIEQILGLAPAAKIIVYQGPDYDTTAADVLGQIVSDNVANVISESWGLCEDIAYGDEVDYQNTEQPLIDAEADILYEAAMQGQSYFAGSGDSGSTSCYKDTQEDSQPDFDLTVADPASQPFATAVGGTAIGTVTSSGTWDLPEDGAYPGEFVWNDGYDPGSGAWATGGGVSAGWSMPDYQANAASALNVISSDSSATCGEQGDQYCREVPDVSADADGELSPYLVYSTDAKGSGWGGIGGTSAAAPLWAALTALINASDACHGTNVGFENPALYDIAGSDYADNFNDITAANPVTGQANNDAFYDYASDGVDPDLLYPVGPGYDMATGLGSPIGDALGRSLCGGGAGVVTVTNPGNQTSVVGQSGSLPISASDTADDATLTFEATGLPAGLTIDPSSGVISGNPTSPASTTVAVKATDQYGDSGDTQFTWTVSAAQTGPAVTVTSPGAQMGVVGTAVSLQISASDTTAGANLTYSASGLPAGLSIGSSTGLISGTPTAAGSGTVTITATDQLGGSGNTQFTWTISQSQSTPPPAAYGVSVANPGSQKSSVGQSVSLQMSATDAASGATLTYTAGGLPSGLTIASSSGLITGTPTAAGSATVTVSASDQFGYSGSTQFSWTINAAQSTTPAIVYSVSVTNPGAQTSIVGNPVSLSMSAADSHPGASLTYTATGLPAGLGFAATGQISGTPEIAGASSVTVTATDQFGDAGHVQFAWTVLAPGAPVGTGTIAGMKTRRAKLKLTLTAGSNAPLLRFVTISLPGGLSLSRGRSAVAVTAGGKVPFSMSMQASTARLAFSSAQHGVTITISKISVSSGLAGKVKRGREKHLGVGLRVGDADGNVMPMSAEITVVS
ncbi:MAG: putative Ig domain-containing protein [Solirubrobacteraceae bacterium]